jgi:tripartite-type tricarboxylate transporter receptor subunit TctC
MRSEFARHGVSHLGDHPTRNAIVTRARGALGSVAATQYTNARNRSASTRSEQGGCVMRRSWPWLAAALLLAGHAGAQEFPNRYITIVAPFQAGGPSDTVARLIAGPMAKALGQQVVVENVSGAGGTIGSLKVAKAAPDGYTLEISGSGTHAAVEQLYANPPYHPFDFDPVGLINTTPVVIVGKRDLPADTLAELIAYLRAHETTVTEADAGVGSVSQLSCSVFHALLGIKPTVVSYRGTPQATQDLLAGRVDVLCNQIVNIVEYAKAGTLKAYAVTGEARSPMLPDVPTTAEAGLPDFKLTVWYGLSAPKGTPAPVIARLNAALSAAMDDPEVAKRFADLGYAVVPPDRRAPAYFDQFMHSEVALWARVLGNVKPAGGN